MPWREKRDQGEKKRDQDLDHQMLSYLPYCICVEKGYRTLLKDTGHFIVDTWHFGALSRDKHPSNI